MTSGFSNTSASSTEVTAAKQSADDLKRGSKSRRTLVVAVRVDDKVRTDDLQGPVGPVTDHVLRFVVFLPVACTKFVQRTKRLSPVGIGRVLETRPANALRDERTPGLVGFCIKQTKKGFVVEPVQLGRTRAVTSRIRIASCHPTTR
jgi:hypothetical protein